LKVSFAVCSTDAVNCFCSLMHQSYAVLTLELNGSFHFTFSFTSIVANCVFTLIIPVN